MEEDDGELTAPDEGLSNIRIMTLPGEEEGSASFEIIGEDHTLGNALRYIIMKNPEVEFCGYSIPHPSEDKMNIRIQIYPEYWEQTRPYDALMKGLDDLADLCDHITHAFKEARDDFVDPEDNNEQR
ncbi:RBP11-like subunits of RNA polymerase [Tuber magnatum]|uniref:RBP11-like subunits of RNA polymerase n=1 Tax=Tuber magnatum TaxID=42249 RepID=A0A317T4N5_9PEZI|nr:RBP11-like subunits of RNA polymerase [Tuber magnatum]